MARDALVLRLETSRSGSSRRWCSWRPRLDFVFGACILSAFAFVAVFADMLPIEDPTTGLLIESRQPPVWLDGGSWAHPLGTDSLGRDVASRLIYGARASLIVGVAGVLVAAVIGVTLGVVAGFWGRWVDIVVMRVVDIQQSIPLLLLALLLVAVTEPGLRAIVIVVGLVSWTAYARMCRAEVLAIREKEYVMAGRVVGASDVRLMIRYVLPNLVGTITVLASLQLGAAIILESSLSYLGLGIQPPDPSWGGMLADGRLYLASAWWLAAFPGAAVMLLVLAANLLGDSLRVQFDPQRRRR